MVKFASLKRLKQLLSKSKNGLNKYAKIKGKLYKKGLPLAQKALNFINKAIIQNDKSVIKNILTKVVPGGNYINMAMDIVGEVIETNMLEELSDILTKADEGKYKSPSALFNDLMKLAEKGKQTVKSSYDDVKKIKKLYDEEKALQNKTEEKPLQSEIEEKTLQTETEEKPLQTIVEEKPLQTKENIIEYEESGEESNEDDNLTEEDFNFFKKKTEADDPRKIFGKPI